MVVHPEVERVAGDIKAMRVRGAGAIARATAQALAIAARESRAGDLDGFMEELESTSKLLLATRPTAVSLPNAVRYVMLRARKALVGSPSLEDIRSLVLATAQEFIENSKTAIKRIGEIGARRITDGDIIMTHCNSAAVTSILRTAWLHGKRFKVYATETRPRLQGWITARELSEVGIPVTMIVDSASRHFMNRVDKVIVGADAVAANGAVVNKVGTSVLALAAHEARTRFFVAVETYKFSPETMLGELVTIEERDPSEVMPKEDVESIPGVEVRNPSFDITPPEYIDLLITERGIIPAQAAILVIQEAYGTISMEELIEYQTYKISEDD